MPAQSLYSALFIRSPHVLGEALPIMKLNIVATLVISLLAFYGSSIISSCYESFVFTFEPVFRFIPLLLVISWLPKLLVYSIAGLVIGFWIKPARPYRWAAVVGVVALILDFSVFPVNEMSHASVTELIYLIVVFFVPLFGVFTGTKLYLMKTQPIRSAK